MCLTKQHYVDNKLCWDLRLLVIIPMWVTWSHSQVTQGHSQVLQSHSHVGHLVSFPVSFPCGSPSLVPSLILMWVTRSHSQSHSQSHSHAGHPVSFPVSFSCGSLGLIPMKNISGNKWPLHLNNILVMSEVKNNGIFWPLQVLV